MSMLSGIIAIMAYRDLTACKNIDVVLGYSGGSLCILFVDSCSRDCTVRRRSHFVTQPAVTPLPSKTSAFEQHNTTYVIKALGTV